MLFNREQNTCYNIILGSSCNWNCPYCIQSDDNVFNKNINVNTFCDKFIEYLHQNNLYNSIQRISIWGGEPLLYYSALEILIKRLSFLPAQQNIRVVTNGSLLTKDNYKLFNDYSAHVAISYHDGQLADDKWKVALNIEDLVVSSIVHGKRLSWESLYNKWEYLYTKFGRCLKWYVFPILDTGCVPQEYQFNFSKIDTYFNNLYSYLNRLDNVFYTTALHGLIYEFSKRGLEKKFFNPCFNDKTVALDLLGNKYLCHHDCSPSTLVGNIFKKTIPIYSEQLNLIQNSSECVNCKAFPYCLGGCFRLRDKQIYCYYNLKMVDFLKTLKEKHSEYFRDDYLGLIK